MVAHNVDKVNIARYIDVDNVNIRKDTSMRICIISDKDFQTEAFGRIDRLVKDMLAAHSADITEAKLDWQDLAPCMGCFGCWVKKPGECVISDAMADLNRTTMTSDAVIYLSPIVFGQFSATIKNAVDRMLPNMLPFFEIRPDGSTMHPARYVSYPKFIMVGYGDGVTAEDARLFADITRKHRRNIEVVVYTGDDKKTAAELASVDIKRTEGKL